MQFSVDTHLHIYPFYNVEQALGSVLQNLSGGAEDMVKIACLTERYDCNLYDELASGAGSLFSHQYDIQSGPDSLVVTDKNGKGQFFLLPGQQIITSENIEILSLSCNKRVEEGQPASDTVRNILSLEGIPVVAWAPGKWFFNRGKIVASLLDQFTPQQLALGDTTLRPLGWGIPGIIKKARQRGFRILYGSDPLPFKGEEIRPGSYSTRIIRNDQDGEIDPKNPAELVRHILTADLSIKPAGSRGSIFDVLLRLYRNHRAPKPSKPVVAVA